MTKISSVDSNLIATRYRAGEAISSLAEAFKVNDKTIRNHIEKNAVKFRKKLSEEDSLSIANKYGEGVSSKTLAKEYGVSSATVIIHAKKHRINIRAKGKRKLSQENLDKAISLYQNGKSIIRIAEEFGVASSTIKNTIVAKGIGVRVSYPKRILDEDKQKQIIDRYLKGESVSWLCEVFKCTTYVIKRILKSSNTPIRGTDKCGGIKFKDKNNRDYYFKSTWEVRVAIWLDKHDFKWDYEKEKYRLSNCTYVPDFWIYKEDNTLHKVIDVKGYKRSKSLKKIEEFIKIYPNINFELWDKEKLEEFKILQLEIPDTVQFVRQTTNISNQVGLEIINNYLLGHTIKEISKLTGHCWDSIKTYLKVHRISIRSMGETNRLKSLSKDKRDRIPFIYSECNSIDLTAKLLSDEVGVKISKDIVYEELKIRNISREKGKEKGRFKKKGVS